jgi:acyl transferase domain-containing protein/thioesterase domain-containing protein/acyl carrier protein/phosphohistidine swiveling domain-containing protein/SAM-dependent methyltransferase
LESDSELPVSEMFELPFNRGDVYAKRLGQWHKQDLIRTNCAEPEQSIYKRKGVYVVIGGAGKIGFAWSQYMINAFDAQIIWIGRRKINADIQSKIDSLASVGQAPLYISTNASDKSAMEQAYKEIKKKYQKIDGVIQSAVVFTVKSVEHLEEEEFMSLISAKTDVSLRMAQIFSNEPLDFFLFFSSIVSFKNDANQSYYAYGSSFMDAFAQSLNEKLPFPVKVLNWGYWEFEILTEEFQEVRNRLEKIGTGFIEAADAMDVIEKFLQSPLNQIAFMKFTNSYFWKSIDQEEQVFIAQDKNSDLTKIFEITPPERNAELKQVKAYHSETRWQEFNKMLARILWGQLQTLGFFTEEKQDISDLKRKANLSSMYDRWIEEIYRYFLAEKQLVNDHNSYTTNHYAVQDMSKLWDEWNVKKEQWLKAPDMSPPLLLVEATIRVLPEIISGKIPASDIMFPNSSMKLVEPVLKHNKIAHFYNKVLAETVSIYIAELLKNEPSKKIRVLEIGAGTGSASAVIFEKLASYQNNIIEYCYTDISKAFLIHGEKEYGKNNPYLTYKIFDIRESAAEQNIDIGKFDAVVASNVLHANHNIRQTIRNAKAVAKKGGVLFLNEISAQPLYSLLTFGLLKDWWLFEDPELRMPGCPGLYPEAWQNILAQEGFAPVYFPVKTSHDLGQQIIIAKSDGIIRQKTKKSSLTIKEDKDNTPDKRIKPLKTRSEKTRNVSVKEYVNKIIIENLAQSLQVEIKAIDTRESFADYGLDSILGVNFVATLNETLNMELETTIIFDYSSVDDLSSYIISEYGSLLESNFIAEKQEADDPSSFIHQKEVNETFNHSADCHQKKIDSKQYEETEKLDIPEKDLIAVIGISGQFPDAENTEIFWKNLISGHDGVGELPSSYLDQSLYYSVEKKPGKTYCKWGGFLKKRDCFDPLFFNISPKEAESMSPNQRLIMIESWKALEDAGYPPEKLFDTNIGMFIGAEPSRYYYESFTGASDAIVASRLPYYLNLNGPAMVVNTGCSSSGVAIHLACESIRNNESSMAIAGGVFASLDHSLLISLSEVEMISPTGRSRAFDESGDGTILSEGVGIVLLKSFKKAIQDGDNIYGLIKGSGLNQDGTSNGITAPNGKSQERLILDVYQRYNINAEDITYIEAHGTGTKLGDPIEANALIRAFKKFTNKKEFCAIGSSKSHIGHTLSASGVTGLIKILLSMRYQTIPGLINFNKLNPLIKLENSPFYFNTKPLEWHSKNQKPLMAALNSFGHSGTNVHIVVQEYFRKNESTSNAFTTPQQDRPFVIPISAKNNERLTEYAANHANFLQDTRHANISLTDFAYTLQTGRSEMENRVAFIVRNMSELIEELKSFKEGCQSSIKRVEGKISQNSKGLSLFESDEELNETVQKWILKNKVNKIAELWTQGFSIDWELFYADTIPKRISLPTYPFANEHFWGIRSENMELINSNRKKESDLKSSEKIPVNQNLSPELYDEPYKLMTFEEYLKEENRFSSSLIKIKTLVCVLTASVKKETVEKAFQQYASDTDIIFIHPRDNVDSFKKESKHYYTVSKSEDKTYENVFEDIIKDYGVIDAILYMPMLSDIEAYSSILSIIQTIAAVGLKSVRFLLTAQLAKGPERCYPESWIGFERSLGFVLPKMQFGIILTETDIFTENWAEILFQEFHAEAIESAFYVNSKRYVYRLRETEMNDSESLIKPGGTYLITGGCGGLGTHISNYFAQKESINLILSGRSKPNEQKRSVIKSIEDTGSKAYYIQADICDFETMKKGLADAKKRFGKINGVIHAAGIESTQSILKKDIKTFNKTVHPKIEGTFILEKLLNEESLDFICFFSSSSAILGDSGACDYAVANRFLMSFANYKNSIQAKEKNIVINWPLWRDGGMGISSEDDAKLYLQSSGQRFLETEEATVLFDRLLSQQNFQHLVLVGKPSRIKRFPGMSKDISLPDRYPSASLTLGKGRRKEMRGFSIAQCIEYDLKEHISNLLKISLDQLHSETNLADFGFDSILLAQFADLLSEFYGMDLSPSIFFGGSTIEKLVHYFLKKHTEVMEQFYEETESVPDDFYKQKTDNTDKYVSHASFASNIIEREEQCRLPKHNLENLSEPVAIIGMSGRFPGARNIDDMWQILAQGKEAVTEIPIERFDWRNFYGNADNRADKMISNRCGIIPGVKEFEPLFFEISPKEAEAMDPRQRLLLQESWKALEDAGYGPFHIKKNKMGIFTGVEIGDYRILSDSEKYIASNHEGILAVRLAYFLNFNGPAMAINTTCSSGLVAVHLACQSLRNRECDTAIAAGVNLMLTPESFIAVSKSGMMSPSGKCFAFDKRANGMVPGEAVVSVVLKRLSDARKDKDQIYAVIKGSDINYDGKTNGITVPNGNAQVELLKSVYKKYKINPKQIDYIVTHGTGTKLGDPVEINALNDAFENYTNKTGFCAITSSKTNFGHTFAASGLLSLINLVQAIRYESIPANINCKEENDYINWKSSPFYVNKSSKPWKSDKRMGAVSAFGMSGTNVHMVVENFQENKFKTDHLAAYSYLWTFSAKTQNALAEKIDDMLSFLQQKKINTKDFPKISTILSEGRHHFRYRNAIVIHEKGDAILVLNQLKNKEKSPAIFYGKVSLDFKGQNTTRKYVENLLQQAGSNLTDKNKLCEILYALAELYCQGYDIPLGQLYGNHNISDIRLPTYPFSKESYWVKPNRNYTKSGSEKRNIQIHPLLHQNTSDFTEQRFSSTFTGEEFFLAEHLINDKPILPGVAYLEMAKVSVEKSAGFSIDKQTIISLNNVVWTRPLIVETDPVNVHIRLFPEDTGEITYEIYSQSDKDEIEQEVVHSQGKAILSPFIEPSTLNIKSIKNNCTNFKSHEDLYGYEMTSTMQILPGFMCIKELFQNNNGKEILARLELPSHLNDTYDDFSLHLSLLNGAFEASSFGFNPFITDGGKVSELLKKGEVDLPFSLGKIEIIKAPLPKTCYAHVILLKEGEKNKTFNIQVSDLSGRIFVRFQNFESLILTRTISSDIIKPSVINKQISKLHPLLHNDVSTSHELKYTSIFTGNEFYFTDHVIGGKKIFPGVAYLEMARAAVENAVGKSDGKHFKVVLKNVVWTRPIKAEKKPVNLLIRLFAKENEDMTYHIYSQSFDSLTESILHSQGTAIIVRIDDIPTYDINSLKSKCNLKKLTSDDCYEALANAGLKYGPGHRGIDKVYVGKNQVLARLVLSYSDHDTQGQFVIHPGLLDSALQSSGFIVDNLTTGSGKPLLPYALERIEIFDKFAFSMWAFVRYSKDSGLENRVVKLDIDVCDEEGRVCTKLRGYSARRFEPSVKGTLLLKPSFIEKKAESLVSEIEFKAYDKHIVILCDIAHISESDIIEKMNITQCLTLKTKEAGIDERFLNNSIRLFETIKKILTDKPKGRILVQLVILNNYENILFSGLSGLLKTASMENSKFDGQLIVIEDTLKTIINKLEENARCPNDNIIRYIDNKRLVEKFEAIETLRKEPTMPWKDKGIYLIIGGAGGLGLIFSNEIVRQVNKPFLILTGRSELTENKKALIEELKGKGASVEYKCMDVTVKKEVQKLIEYIKNKFGGLNGIIHSAGIIHDNYIINKTGVEFEKVMAPKTMGLKNLDDESKDIQLDFFVIFSSGAGVFGNTGQADYACANAFIDAYAQYRDKLVKTKKRFGKTLSINWPLWKKGGMYVDKATEKRMEILNMSAMDTDKGINAFYQSFLLNQCQVIVLEGDIEKMKNNLLFTPHASSVRKSLRSPSKTNTTKLSDNVKQLLTNEISKLMKIGTDLINLDDELNKYGFDSVSFVEFTNILNQKYKLSLPPTLFFEYPTINSISKHLISEHHDVFAKHFKVENDFEKSEPVIQKTDDIPVAKKRFRYAAAITKQDTFLYEPVAIIGMSGQFPMAQTIENFWNNILEGKNCITEIPKERWNWREVIENTLKNSNKESLKWGGFIDGIKNFDPDFFEISMREAEMMDPQQRLLMLYTRKAIEDAGITPKAFSQKSTGVFISPGMNEYVNIVSIPKNHPFALTGIALSAIPNRISYAFNLKGPSEYYETACSSALVALHRAIASIHAGECEQAIIGAVNLLLSPKLFITSSASGYLSRQGKSKSFQAEADGFVRSEGVGVVIIKSLQKAIHDNDQIYAVIRGSGVSHGGKSMSLTTPSARGMKAAMHQAFKSSGIDSQTISYIEAHGTASIMGDAIEIDALKSGYQALLKQNSNSDQKQSPCYISSLKPCIGHAEIASGIAALIKVVMAINKKIIPGIPGFKNLNENISLQGSRFQIVAENHKWNSLTDTSRKKIPRRAAINSYGVGGVNVHVLVEEYGKEERIITKHMGEQVIFVLSAKTQKALNTYANNMLDFFENNSLSNGTAEQKTITLSDIAYTLQTGREAMTYRLAMVINNKQEVIKGLKTYLQNSQKGVSPEAINIFAGNSEKDKSELQELLSGKAGDAVLKIFIEDKNLEKLAHYWVKGFDIPWKSLYKEKTPRKVSLPTYPFQTISCWLPEKSNDHFETVEKNISENQVLPRNRTELELVRIWEETLSVSPIGIKDDFFEIGGNSLFAIQIIGKIEKQFDKNLPLATLINAPVIEKLAEILTAESTLFSPLVPLQSKGKKTPLFFLPGGNGRSFYLYDFAKSLGEDRPFYALEEPGVYENISEPVDKMETLADIFLSAIYEIQPKGPYYIAGHSSGVPVAFAMVSELEKQGAEVAFFGVLDIFPLFGDISSYTDETELLLVNARAAAERMGKEINFDPVKLRSLPYNDQLNLVADELIKIGWLPSGNGAQQMRTRVKISKIRRNMMISYTPENKISTVPITLFRATDPYNWTEKYEAFSKNPDMGWGKYSNKPIKILKVPGDHMSITLKPNVDVLAKTVNESMEISADSDMSGLSLTSKETSFEEPDTEGRFWGIDTNHFPDQIYPLDFSLVLKTMYDETTGTISSIYGFSPFRLISKHIGGYFYCTYDYEITDDNNQAAFEKMKNDAMRINELWENEWLPEIKEHIDWWEKFNAKTASNDSFVAHFEDTWKHLKRVWEIHHLLYYTAMLSINLFSEFYQDLFPDEPDQNSYRLLSGFSNSFIEGDIALWDLSRIGLEISGVQEFLQKNDSDNVLKELKSFKQYDKFSEALENYLKKFGRLSSLPSVISFEESPKHIINKLLDYMAKTDEVSPAAIFEKLEKEKENQVENIFQQISGYPEPIRKEFRTYLKVAQYSYMLITEHTWWIEGRVPYCLRQIITVAGHRLVTSGIIHSHDDIFYLLFEEVIAAMKNMSEVDDIRDLVRKRKNEEERFKASGPPPFIGEPPSKAPPENFFTKIYEKLMAIPVKSESEHNSEDIYGVPASPGNVTGTAKIIGSVTEGVEKLKPGDIMITKLTMPDWASLFSIISGLVTDTGGTLCHSAIVAREYGIPAVVGTGTATSMINDGQKIKIDGSKGTIRIV